MFHRHHYIVKCLTPAIGLHNAQGTTLLTYINILLQPIKSVKIMLQFTVDYR